MCRITTGNASAVYISAGSSYALFCVDVSVALLDFTDIEFHMLSNYYARFTCARTHTHLVVVVVFAVIVTVIVILIGHYITKWY